MVRRPIPVEPSEETRLAIIERDASSLNLILFGNGFNKPGELNKIHDELSALKKAVDKINRNTIIAAALILGAGIGSRMFSADVIELLKKVVGL